MTLRMRLTFWYALAFAGVLALVLGVLALEMKQQFEEEIKHALRTEERWLTSFFESRFLGLLTLQGREYATLDSVLHEELEERYGMKRQFGLIVIKRDGVPVLFDGGLKKAPELLPRDFLNRAAGTYIVPLQERRYRVRVFHPVWGEVAVGIEDETIYRVAHEAAEVLILIVPLAFLLAMGGGWLLARLAMRPVLSAAQTAKSISVTNLKERLPEYQGHDEFGELAATLNLMIARLEKGVTRLQQFTQDAAHELRTPLTILRGDLELAYQNENASEEARAFLQKTLDRVIALGQIVDNLMLLARSDSGQYPLTKTLFQLDTVVREIFEDTQILAEARSLAVRLPSCDRVEFFGDELLVRRLLLNLCDNAVKYTLAGNIELSLQRQGEMISLRISDTGCGIPAEDLPHIFDRFYRVDKSHSSVAGGSGLGLSICQWIVAAHGGTIEVISKFEKGTTVQILLPGRPAQNLG